MYTGCWSTRLESKLLHTNVRRLFWRTPTRSWPCGAEMDEEVLLEIAVPFWTDPSDVALHIQQDSLHIYVRGALDLTRTYFSNRCRTHCMGKRACHCVIRATCTLYTI